MSLDAGYEYIMVPLNFGPLDGDLEVSQELALTAQGVLSDLAKDRGEWSILSATVATIGNRHYLLSLARRSDRPG